MIVAGIQAVTSPRGGVGCRCSRPTSRQRPRSGATLNVLRGPGHANTRSGGNSPHSIVLFRNGKVGGGEGFLNQAIRIEVTLPVVLVIAVRTHRKDGTGPREGQDLHIG